MDRGGMTCAARFAPAGVRAVAPSAAGGLARRHRRGSHRSSPPRDVQSARLELRGRRREARATAIPWTADQAWGLVVGFALVAVWFSSTRIDKFVADAQRRQLGLEQLPDEEEDQNE